MSFVYSLKLSTLEWAECVIDAMEETRIPYRNLDGKWCKGFNIMPCFNIYLERMRKNNEPGHERS
jgi:hypothetical protein